MKTISLCMIVKNESHVIERCLDSVKPLIDFVLIQDTGSEDNTINIINDWLYKNQMDGVVFSEPWKNFAHNRSLSLSKLRDFENIDYALMIDADETLIFENDFDITNFKNSMIEDVFDITTKMGGISYIRPQITSNKKKFSYEGVLHEFLTGEINTRSTVNGFYNQPVQDSYRNKNGNKFENDVILLKKAIDETSDPWFKSRYTFYLAQSLRDLQKSEESLKYYKLRSEMGFWNEEVFISYLNVGNLMRELNYPSENIISNYLKGHESCPNRVECLYNLLHYCRVNSLHHFGYMVGKHALSIIKPLNSLFCEDWMYDYGVLDEFSIVSYYSNHFEDSKESCERLLSENKIPHHYIDRVKDNLKFAVNKLNV